MKETKVHKTQDTKANAGAGSQKGKKGPAVGITDLVKPNITDSLLVSVIGYAPIVAVIDTEKQNEFLREAIVWNRGHRFADAFLAAQCYWRAQILLMESFLFPNAVRGSGADDTVGHDDTEPLPVDKLAQKSHMETLRKYIDFLAEPAVSITEDKVEEIFGGEELESIMETRYSLLRRTWISMAIDAPDVLSPLDSSPPTNSKQKQLKKWLAMLKLMDVMDSNVAHARNIAYEKKPNAYPLAFDLERERGNTSMAKLKKGKELIKQWFECYVDL